MAVRIANAPASIKCPATYHMHGADGQRMAVMFQCVFRRLGKSERTELMNALAKGEADLSTLLDKVMTGWEGMNDEHGRPVPYSREARLATEEAYPEIEQAMAVSFFDHAAVMQREAAAKNSVPPSAISSAQTAA